MRAIRRPQTNHYEWVQRVGSTDYFQTFPVLTIIHYYVHSHFIYIYM